MGDDIVFTPDFGGEPILPSPPELTLIAVTRLDNAWMVSTNDGRRAAFLTLETAQSHIKALMLEMSAHDSRTGTA